MNFTLNWARRFASGRLARVIPPPATQNLRQITHGVNMLSAIVPNPQFATLDPREIHSSFHELEALVYLYDSRASALVGTRESAAAGSQYPCEEQKMQVA